MPVTAPDATPAATGHRGVPIYQNIKPTTLYMNPVKWKSHNHLTRQ